MLSELRDDSDSNQQQVKRVIAPLAVKEDTFVTPIEKPKEVKSELIQKP